VEIILASPTGAALGTNKKFTFTIQQTKPVVGFTSAASSGPETQNANLQVTLNTPSASTVTVKYAVSGGTAKSATDFTLPSGMLTFQPGQTTANIPITIVNHNVDN